MAATEWVGCKLRTAWGRRRNVSGIVPVQHGVFRTSKTGGFAGECSAVPVIVGTMTVPVGPTAGCLRQHIQVDPFPDQPEELQDGPWYAHHIRRRGQIVRQGPTEVIVVDGVGDQDRVGI